MQSSGQKFLSYGNVWDFNDDISKVFFLNGGWALVLIASLISPPSGKEVFSWNTFCQVGIVWFLQYGSPSGMISLKRILQLLSKTLCLCSSVKACWGCLLRYQHVVKWTQPLVAITASSQSLKTDFHSPLHFDQLLPCGQVVVTQNHVLRWITASFHAEFRCTSSS